MEPGPENVPFYCKRLGKYLLVRVLVSMPRDKLPIESHKCEASETVVYLRRTNRDSFLIEIDRKICCARSGCVMKVQ